MIIYINNAFAKASFVLLMLFASIECMAEGSIPVSKYAVDLGLPSGTLWADRNVGANRPEDNGDFFAWGEIKPKSTFDWSTYMWFDAVDSTMIKYSPNIVVKRANRWCIFVPNSDTIRINIHTNSRTVEYGADISFSGSDTTIIKLYPGISVYEKYYNKTVLDVEDDAATANMGKEWRMPTEADLRELLDKCTWTWTTQKGTNGYQVTGPNGNSIFLPAAGCHDVDSYGKSGSVAYYWTATLNESFSSEAVILSFARSGFTISGSLRCRGISVRAVVR